MPTAALPTRTILSASLTPPSMPPQRKWLWFRVDFHLTAAYAEEGAEGAPPAAALQDRGGRQRGCGQDLAPPDLHLGAFRDIIFSKDVGNACLQSPVVTQAFIRSLQGFPKDYTPTVFDNYMADIAVRGRKLEMSLWDTAGPEDYGTPRGGQALRSYRS